MQDLEFPAACHRLKLTPDGEYLFATGIHAPRVRVYELGQLSLKFERHFDAEVVDFQARSPPAWRPPHHHPVHRAALAVCMVAWRT